MTKESKDTKKSVEDIVSSVTSSETVGKAVEKVLDTEVQTLQYYDRSFQQLIFTLGRISVSISDLEAQKRQAIDELTKLRQQEAGFNQILTAKYGEVEVDIQTGNISPKK